MIFSRNRVPDPYLKIDAYKFETVESFTYLGSIIISDNRISPEIRNGLYLANTPFYGLKMFIKSRFLSRNMKVLIFKTVLTYASETWTTT